jgi:hypothetical protein
MAGDFADIRGQIEIRDALARYCRAMDRIDDDLADSIWHAGATVNYEPGIYRGSAHDFVRWVHAFHETVDTTIHRIANITVRIRGTHAGSEAYGHVILVQRAGDGGTVDIRHSFGRYIDRWSFRDDRWAIDHREYRRDFGYSATGEATQAAGSRDRTDVSYEILSSDIADPTALDGLD